MRENSKSDSLNFFPVYILCYTQGQNKNASIEKVFSCGDDGVFPSFNPCVLVLKDGHFYNVWDYNRLFNEIDCPNINQKKRNKGSGERYKKHFCLRCMVSYSLESLHVSQGRCANCLETVENHLNYDNSFHEEELHCSMCERHFTNEFCYQSHRIKKSNGECRDYCQFLKGLRNCKMCLEDFQLTLCCKHFNKPPSQCDDVSGVRRMKKRCHDEEEVFVGSSQIYAKGERGNYIKCGFCSDFYLRGTVTHSCFLKKSDSIFGNPNHRSSTIKSHNVFYYDIESRLETCYECKVEQREIFDELGNMVSVHKQLRKTFFASSQSEVDKFKLNLTPRELCLLNVPKCQSHQPTLLCIVNELGSVKRDFCEQDLHGSDPILSLLVGWLMRW